MRGRGLDGAREVVALAGTPQPLQLDVVAARQQLLPVVEHFRAARRRGPAASALPSSPCWPPDRPINPSSATGSSQSLSSTLRPPTGPARRSCVSNALKRLKPARFWHSSVIRDGLAILARLGNPNVGADDRLHAARQRRLVELHERRDVALIRDRTGRHALVGHGVDERIDAQQAIDERVLRVDAQMDEAVHRACSAPTSRTGANVARWIAHGPNFSRARKCSAVA